MKSMLYEKLRDQLDQYSNGFPRTESGIELKILKKLFTEKDADLYLDLSLMLETPESVALRIGRDGNTVAIHLEDMARRGLIFRLRKDAQVMYAAAPFIVGFYEYQLKSMDRELADMVETYFREKMFHALSGNIVPLRTVPVEKAIDVPYNVSTYANARDIVRSKNRIAVAECICRKQKGLLGKACNKPKEVCLVFGSHAAFYVENRMARDIDQEEAIQILDVCEKAGLVNQPANMVNPGGMCNCCGDCCAVLQSLKMIPRPADMVFNDYVAFIDEDLCSACEICLDRCQMDAIRVEEEAVCRVEKHRCIGCGLCVTTCPTGAIGLERKPEDEIRMPPQDGRELMTKLSELRNTSPFPLSMQKQNKRG